MTYEEIAEKRGVTMDLEPATSNPFMEAGDPLRDRMSHYAVTLRRPHAHEDAPMRWFACHYSQGFAHTEPPTIGALLECLTMDFTMHEDCAGKWDYFDTFGIEPSEQAERDYYASKAQSDRFFAFASGDLLRDLLECES